MKATDLLQKQHRDIEALLERLSAAGQADEQRIRQELAAILVAHTVIEEEMFYPAVREVLPEDILEALEEHGLADVELARLLAAGTGDDDAEARTSVLSALVTRHIRREESDIFKAANRELGDEHLTALSEQMATRFREVLDTGYEKLLRMALEEEVPRTTIRARAAKKAGRRTSAAKKAKTTRRAAANKARTPSRRGAAKHATAKRGPAKRATAKRGAAPKRTTAKRGAAAKRASSKRTAANGAVKRSAGSMASTKRTSAPRAAKRTSRKQGARPAHQAEMPMQGARGAAQAHRTRG